MKLVDVHDRPVALVVLYALLRERQPHVSISHREMPTFDEHERFVRSRPYAHWYLIEVEDKYIGAIYLTHNDEIGIHIFGGSQDKGHGHAAVALLMKAHPRKRYLANINPANKRARSFLESIGFHALQETLEFTP